MSTELELSQIGKIWTKKDLPNDIVKVEYHENAVNLVYKFLTQKPPRSVLIMGQAGVGKSTLIQLIAEHLKSKNWFIFMAGASDLMAGQRYIGDLEQQVKNVISCLTQKKKAVWIIPRFHELYYGGRHEFSPTGILDQILPYVETGQLKIIGESQPALLEKIISFRPQLKMVMDALMIEPSSTEYSIKIAKEWCAMQNTNSIWKDVSDDLIIEATLLSAQYLTKSAEPGSLLEFLKVTQKKLESKGRANEKITIPDLVETLAETTGLPKTILDDSVKLDLDNIRDEFRKRVVGQDEALDVIIERIAMIKAGLTDPGRPAGVFLFIGPTGTGKTEIAKTLAHFLFGSEERMIRMDMSEFQTQDSIHRLIGYPNDNSESVAMVNQIRHKPFSVILLDEFEKANSNIWDLFLQVFDDGRLTDPSGTTADFRHAIIIMTSNIGASIPNRTKIGYTTSEHENPDSNKNVYDVVSSNFRPEFINRIDRIVQFNPLSRSVMRKILKSELKKVLTRRGFRQRQWAVEWEDSAIEFLLEKGFSSNLGARPMKRAVERFLLAPLAITIVKHQFPEGDQFLFVKRGEAKLKVDFVDPDEPELKWKDRKKQIDQQLEKAVSLSIKRVAFEAQGTLAEYTVLSESFTALKEKVDDPSWINQKQSMLSQMSEPDFWNKENRYDLLTEIEFRDRFESGLESAESLMDRLQSGKKRVNYSSEHIRRLAEKLFIMQQSLDAFEKQQPQDAFLRVFIDAEDYNAKDQKFAARLTKMYKNWIKKRKMKFVELDKEGKEFKIAISGFGAYSILKNETGIHLHEVPGKSSKFDRSKVKVEVVPQPDYYDSKKQISEVAMESFENNGAKKMTIVRRYREKPSPLVRDSVNGWRTGKIERVMDGDFDLIE